jgi:hypothetical protein
MVLTLTPALEPPPALPETALLALPEPALLAPALLAANTVNVGGALLPVGATAKAGANTATGRARISPVWLGTKLTK